jgi:hypothetical protein
MKVISWYSKCIRRIKRYGPWEIFATTGALLWGYIASRWTTNPAIIGYAGAWWENFLYYGYFLFKEYRDQQLFYNKKISLWTVFSGMISEFWPGELLDSFVMKPLLMWIWSERFGVIGFIIGKYTADVVYYSLATVLYNKKTERRIDTMMSQLENKIKVLDQKK